MGQGTLLTSAVGEREFLHCDTTVKVATLLLKSGENPDASQPSLTPSQKRGEAGNYFLTVVEIPARHVVSIDTVSRNLVIGQWEWKFQLPTGPSLTSPCQGYQRFAI